jgi:phosphoribosylformylglycinamidine synthase
MCTARRFPHQRIGVLDDGGGDAAQPVLDVQGQFTITLDELRTAREAPLPQAMA